MNQDQMSSTMRGFTHANHEMVADLFDMSCGPAATKSSLLVCLFVFVGLGLTIRCNSAGISACFGDGKSEIYNILLSPGSMFGSSSSISLLAKMTYLLANLIYLFA